MHLLLLIREKLLPKNISKVIYFTSFLFIVSSFIFLPHTVELTGVLETWFPFKGLIYYKDFAAYHLPLGRRVLLPLHLLTNWDLRADPFFALITALLTLHIIYLYSKRLSLKLPLAAGTLFFAFFFWYAATAVLFFHEMLIGLLLALAALLVFGTQKTESVNPKTAFLIGLVLSIAEFSGQLTTPTILVIIGLTIILWRKKINFIMSLKYLGIGFFIPLLGLLVYFYKQNALDDFYFWNIPYYFTYNNNPKPSLSNLPLTELLAFYTPLLLIFLLLLKSKKRDFESVFLFISSLSSIPFIFFSIYHPHHLSYILPLLSLTFSKAVYLLLKNKFKLTLFLGITLFATISILYLLPWHQQRLRPPSLTIINDTFPGDHMYETVQWVKNNTSEKAKILVIGDPMFYMRSNRLPASRPSKGQPYSWEPFLEVKKELLAQPAEYWVVDQRFVDRLADTHHRPYMVEFIHSELEQCYKKVFKEENWEVYLRTCSLRN